MKIKKITKINRNNEDVYNLEVEDNHNYYADDILVSNCHGLRNQKDAKAVLSLIEKTKNAHYRMGATGTLRDGALNKLQIVAMFGEVYKAISTKKLMDKDFISKLKIKKIKIKYPFDITAQINRLDWNSQQEFIESEDNPRQHVILELAKSRKENTMILFRKINHGTYIYNELLKTSREVYYIDGQLNVDDREDIRKRLEENNNIILVCSFGTSAQGINIKNIHNIIFASSYKSKIRVLQSIGRGLRLHDNKDKVNVYDICDSIKYYSRHSDSRNELYDSENFDYSEKELVLEKWCHDKKLSFFD